MAGSILEKYVSTRDGMRKFQQERAIYEITKLITSVMDSEGVSKSDLAARINKSKSWVSQFLNSGANKTVRTVADVLAALNHEFHGVACPIRLRAEHKDSQAISKIVSVDVQQSRLASPRVWQPTTGSHGIGVLTASAATC